MEAVGTSVHTIVMVLKGIGGGTGTDFMCLRIKN
jgi:hypothetical protein